MTKPETPTVIPDHRGSGLAWTALSVLGIGFVSLRLLKGSTMALEASRTGEPHPMLPDRRLYVSLDGVERTKWKASLALLTAGVFGAGVLVGRSLSPGRVAPADTRRRAA